MRLNAEYFEAILSDLIDENTLACAAVLRIVDVHFTDSVPTLAVTTEEKSRLLVNLDFVSENCHSEEEVKAVLLHEFLHVLLNHTVDFKIVNLALNIAMDAVINAIIHRLAGSEYSGFFSRFYAKETGITRLLRPYDPKEESNDLEEIWFDLYDGKLIVDDILDLAEQFIATQYLELLLIGNHDDLKALNKSCDSDYPLGKAIQKSLEQMDGTGIWRDLQIPGNGLFLSDTNAAGISDSYKVWEKDAWRILRKCLTDDKSAHRSVPVDIDITLPVLTPSDRRAWLKAGWLPILPDAHSTTEIRKRESGKTAQVYLDVSGSMSHELNALVGLLWKLRRYIRSPFWSFANTVESAKIIEGKLKTRGTGGTDLNPVLEHIIKTGAKKSIIITDGFVGGISPDLLEQVKSDQQIYGIISRDGVTEPFQAANIEYAQLGRYTS